MIDRLVLASRNAGKLREFTRLLAPLAIDVIAQAELGIPDADEPHITFVENALAKARHASVHARLPALADDSGVCVAALNGAPGVHSARYAGAMQDSPANMTKLLQALAGVPEARRTARFRCVLVVARPLGETLVAEGTCEGRITAAPGGSGGFGYDPIFFYPPAGKTFAELAAAVKNQVGHRGRACAQLRPRLLEFMRV